MMEGEGRQERDGARAASWTESTARYWDGCDSTGLPDPDAEQARYRGVPVKRLMAYMLDLLFLIPVMAVIAAVIGLLGLFTLGLGWALMPFALWLGAFAYHVMTLGSGRSATPGMRMMGVEIRDFRGRRFTMGGAAVHVILFYVALGSVFLIIGNIVCMMVSRYGRGIHDWVLGSAGINSD